MENGLENSPSVYFIFNRDTKALVTVSADAEIFTNGNFLIKKIKLSDHDLDGGEFNLARFRWEGDYDTGKLIDLFKEKKAVVTEEEIDRKYYSIFFRKYSVEDTLFNIIIRTDSAGGANASQNFHDMRIFLINILDKKQKEIEFYKNSPNHIYESRDEQRKKIEQGFKI